MENIINQEKEMNERLPLAIIKYNAGNIQSVMFALERLGVNAVVTDNISQIQQANKVIFPGVGEASSAMQYLRERGLDQVIRELHQPVLGICLGMQLLCSHSEENDTSCLDIVPVQVRKFISESGEGRTKAPLKVPQVGWNNIYSLRTKLFDSVLEDSFIYNVHSYYAESSKYSIASCEYGVEYAAAVRKDNFYGVQFHAEKSAGVGAQILKNFIEL